MLVTVGVVDEKVVTDAFNVVGRGGVVVATGLTAPEKFTIHLSGAILTKFEKTTKGSMFGSGIPHYDIVKLLRLYDVGGLRLAELATKQYTLDQINEGYRTCATGRLSVA